MELISLPCSLPMIRIIVESEQKLQDILHKLSQIVRKYNLNI
jgi:PII-like signaling protein